MEGLIKITRLDFSEQVEVSDLGDELDAIAVGLNTMAEELEFHLHELKLSEQKLNDAQRLAKIGNWEMNVETKEVQWSDEMFNLYGYGEERFEIDFEKALERMLPEVAELSKNRMKENVSRAVMAFEENGTLESDNPPVTYTLVMPDNSRKIVQGIGKIILTSKGQVSKMIGTVQDITEQYHAEQSLSLYNIELEKKNKEIE